jgi:hypothetical protein
MAPVPPLLLLLLLLELPRLVPFQSGASPLAAATASPRKPITEASQSWSLPPLASLEMLALTAPSVPLEPDDKPRPPPLAELPKALAWRSCPTIQTCQVTSQGRPMNYRWCSIRCVGRAL